MQRKRHSADFKAKVALSAIKEQKTINEISAEFEVHPVQISQWKKQVLDGLSSLYAPKNARSEAAEEILKASLYQQIGQLKVELDWLKKKSGLNR
jgi:putative transposase